MWRIENMPTRITNFIHDSIQTGAQVLGTAFDVADVHVHDLTVGLPAFQRNSNFSGIVEGIHIKLTSATSATKVFVRITCDPQGDVTLVPDTEASLVAGVTTASDKCAAYRVDLPLFQILGGPGNGSLYLFARVDDATSSPVMAQTCITWRE
jgi:hypothetical protein